MHRPFLPAALLALTTTVIASTVTVAVSGAAHGATGDQMSIRVELDLPSAAGAGPRVFEVSGVTPGPGAELTAMHEVSNPSQWCGTVSVDVDPAAKTISVGPDSTSEEDSCDVETVKVTVAAPGFTSVTRTGGDLLVDAVADNPVTRTAVAGADGLAMTWTTTPDEPLLLDGTETFSYVRTAVVTPTPPVVTPPSAFVPRRKPFLKGRALVGRTLVVRNVNKTGFVPRATSVSVRWYRGSQRIKGAHRLAYKIKKADRGRRISARIVVRGPAPRTTFVLRSATVQRPRQR